MSPREEKLIDLIRLLRQEFLVARIDAKTGWGKNEIRSAFEQALSESLAMLADGLEPKL